MSKAKTIIIAIFVLIFIGVLGTVAVLTAQRQNADQSVSPTVPQITPHASEPTTTAACATSFTVTSDLKCNGVTISPTSTTITSVSDVRSLTAAATGGTSPVTFTWAITTDKSDKGSLSSTTGTTVTWTPPSLSDTQTWSIAATATDASGKTDSSGCSVTLNYTKPATPTHKECQNNACVTVNGAGTDNCPNNCQPTTYQHKVCLGNSCSSVQCSPSTTPCADGCNSNSDCGTTTIVTPPATHRECRNNACVSVSGAGTDTCTSDVSCQPVAVAPPIPKSGSTEITIGAIILGFGAIVAGLLLAL